MKKLLLLISLIAVVSQVWATTFIVDEAVDAWPETGESTCAAPVDPAQFNGNFIEALRQANAGNVDTISFVVPTYTSGKYGTGMISCASNIVIEGNGVVFKGRWDASLQVQGSNNHISGMLFQEPLWVSGDDNDITDCSTPNFTVDGARNTIKNSFFTEAYASAIQGTDNVFEEVDFKTRNLGNLSYNAIRVTGNSNKFIRSTFDVGNSVSGPLKILSDFNVIDGCTFAGRAWFGDISPTADPSNDNIITNSSFNSHLEIEGSRNKISNTVIGGNFVLGNFLPIYANDNEVTDVTVGDPNDVNSISRILFIGSRNVLDNVNLTGTSVIFAEGNNNVYKNSDVHVVTNPNINHIDLDGIISEAGVQFTSGTNLSTIDNVHVHHSGFVIEECDQNCIDAINAGTGVSNEISGIQVNVNSTGNIIKNSRAEEMWNGVYVLESNSTQVTNNTLSSNVNMGVVVRDVDATTITGNRTGGNHNGIHIYPSSSNVDVSSNYSFNNRFHGVVVQSNSLTGVTISDNTVFGNAGNGVYLYQSSNTSIDNNIIGKDTLGNAVGNLENGIIIEGSGNNSVGTTTGNTISNSGQNGLKINGSNSNEVWNNTFGGTNTSHAILVDGGSTLNKIGTAGFGNTISNRTSSLSAIAIDGGTTNRNTIRENSTFCNAGPGIELSNGGNDDYGDGVVTINRAETFLSGTAPAGALVHIYDADVQCTPLCTATKQESLSQGMTYVKTVTADASGYWEDLTGDVSTAIVNATDPNNDNSSAFSTCSDIRTCQDILGIDLVVKGGGIPEYCKGGSVDLVASSTTQGVTFVYEWYLDDVLQPLLTTNEITADQPGEWKVIIGDQDDPAVCNDKDSIVVIENENTNNLDATGPATACEGALDLEFNVTGGDVTSTYTWSSVDSKIDLNSTVGVNLVQVFGDVVLGSSGTAVVNVIETDINGCEGAPAEASVVITSLPTAPTIGGDLFVLCEATASYTITSSKTGLKFSWTVPAGATITSRLDADSTGINVKFGKVGGTITATPITIAGECIGLTPASVDVTIRGCDLQADFSTSLSTPCIGSPVTFEDKSTVDAGSAIVSWEWNFGDGATPATHVGQIPPSVVYSTVGAKTVSLIVTDNGAPNGTPQATSDTIMVDVITIGQNSSNLIINGPNEACDKATGLAFDVTGGGTGTNYAWSNSDGKLTVNNLGGIDEINTTASVVAGSSGIAIIEVVETDANGCEANTNKQVTIIDLPTKPEMSGDPSVLCGGTASYTITSSTLGLRFSWSVPAGATITGRDDADSTGITVQFGTTQGKVTATPISIVGGCVGDVVEEIDVVLTGCGLQANFIKDAPVLCVGSPVTFTDESTKPDNSNIDSWEWDFGDGATPATFTTTTPGENPPSVSYATAGAKTITLTITDDGTPEATSTEIKTDYFIIDQNTKVLDVSGPDNACEEELGLDFIVNNPTVDAIYTWSNADGKMTVNNLGGVNVVSTTADIVAGATGTATINVTETNLNGCDAIGSKTVNIIDLPTTPEIDGQATALCNDMGIQYGIKTPVAGISYKWTVPSDASIADASGADSVWIKVDFGTASGELITATPVSDIAGCVGLVPAEIQVDLSGCNLVADFTTSLTGLCEGDTVVFTDASTVDAPSKIDNWEWDFGPGATPSLISGQGPHKVVFASSGLKNVKLTVMDDSQPVAAVSSTTGRTVLINANPAAPTVVGPTVLCEDSLSVYRVNPTNWPTSSYDFELGSGSAASIVNPYHNTDSVGVLSGSGDYSVVAIETDANGCTSEGTLPVSVNVLPRLGPIMEPARVCDKDSKEDYTFSINSSYINSDPAFAPWSVSPDIFDPSDAAYDPLAVWTSVNDTAVTFNFGSYTGPLTLTYEVPAPSCGGGVSTVEASSTIIVSETNTYDVTINPQTVCVDDNKEYDVSWTIDGVDYPFRLSNFTYQWIHNEKTLRYTSDTALVKNIQRPDSLTVEVTFPNNVCYTPSSDSIDKIYLNPVDRPGANLWVDQLEDGMEVGIRTDEILVLNDLSDIVFTDETQRLMDLATSADYTFVLSERLKGAKENGKDSINVYVPNGSVSSLSSPNFTQSWYTYDQDTTVHYLAVSNSVCWDYDTVVVVIDFNIHIPNVFTPNGDGAFDVWWIKNIHRFPNNKVTVYNRWGSIVFDEKGYDNEEVVWTGEKDGGPLPFGTYYYIVDLGNGSDPKAGYVSIIK